MNKKNKMLVKRALWYMGGLILFFAPFALYQKVLFSLMSYYRPGYIHSFCLRMPLFNLFTGKWYMIVPVIAVTLLLFFILTFIFGAFFCGRLCITGAFPEYLSRLIPDRFKIDWSKIVNPVSIRYGFLAGYLITPFIAGSICCSFCNLSLMQKLIDGGFWGEFGVLGSTTLITFFIWLIPFGIFTKGGRGFCNFICPIGAVQNLVYAIGSRFNFTYKLKYAKDKCTLCGNCAKDCVMGSLKKEDGVLTYQTHNCITCLQCTAICPSSALSYGTGNSGWQDNKLAMKPVSDKPNVIV